jgi:hypothetical protein
VTLVTSRQQMSLPGQSDASSQVTIAPAHDAPGAWHEPLEGFDRRQHCSPGTPQVVSSQITVPGVHSGPPGGGTHPVSFVALESVDPELPPDEPELPPDDVEEPEDEWELLSVGVVIMTLLELEPRELDACELELWELRVLELEVLLELVVTDSLLDVIVVVVDDRRELSTLDVVVERVVDPLAEVLFEPVCVEVSVMPEVDVLDPPPSGDSVTVDPPHATTAAVPTARPNATSRHAVALAPFVVDLIVEPPPRRAVAWP